VAQKSWFLKGDVVSGAVLAALGVYIISEARQWNYVGPEGPGPGFFPMWYGIAMVVLSLWLVVVSAVRPAVAGAKVDWKGVGRAMLVWAVFALCTALLKLLGLLTVAGFADAVHRRCDVRQVSENRLCGRCRQCSWFLSGVFYWR